MARPEVVAHLEAVVHLEVVVGLTPPLSPHLPHLFNPKEEVKVPQRSLQQKAQPLQAVAAVAEAEAEVAAAADVPVPNTQSRFQGHFHIQRPATGGVQVRVLAVNSQRAACVFAWKAAPAVKTQGCRSGLQESMSCDFNASSLLCPLFT